MCSFSLFPSISQEIHTIYTVTSLSSCHVSSLTPLTGHKLSNEYEMSETVNGLSVTLSSFAECGNREHGVVTSFKQQLHHVKSTIQCCLV